MSSNRSRNPAEALHARSRRVCASVGASSGRGQPRMAQLTLKRTTSEGLLAWKKSHEPALRFPGSRSGRFVTSSQRRRGDQRASSFAEPADVFKPNAAPCVAVNPLALAVMWPKRGCRSGPPLPAYGVSIPTLLHASSRGKFSSAG